MISQIEQEIMDACTAMDVVRSSVKQNDTAMLVTALKDARKRINRILKAVDVKTPMAAIDPHLPTSPRLPITDGEV